MTDLGVVAWLVILVVAGGVGFSLASWLRVRAGLQYEALLHQHELAQSRLEEQIAAAHTEVQRLQQHPYRVFILMR